MELKKGETILTDAALHLPAACLHEAFSKRSGVPPGHFELYYRGKRLGGGEALASWGVGKDATIEVKMRGRGGMGDQERKQVPEGEQPSGSKDHAEKKLKDAQDAGTPRNKGGGGGGGGSTDDDSGFGDDADVKEVFCPDLNPSPTPIPSRSKALSRHSICRS